MKYRTAICAAAGLLVASLWAVKENVQIQGITGARA